MRRRDTTTAPAFAWLLTASALSLSCPAMGSAQEAGAQAQVGAGQPPASAAAPAAALPTADAGANTPAAPTPAEAAALADSQVDALPEADPAFAFMPQTPAAEGGLTEAAVVERALSVSSRVRAANAAAETAERRAGRAYAVFVPHVDLTASYRRLSEVPVPAGFEMIFPPIENSFSLRAAMRVPVSDYFLALRDRYDSAQHLHAVEDLRRRAERQAVAHEARREYFQLARSLAADTLSRHRVLQLERFAAEIETLVTGGELGVVALAQARSRLASARAMAERDAANRRVAEEIVRRRLALPLGAPVGIAVPLAATVPEAPGELEPLLHEADDKRPELQALRALITAHTHTRDAVAAGRYPTLALVGDVNLDSPNQRHVPPREEFNSSWTLGAELTWSPTSLAAKNDELDESRLALTRAREDLDGLRSAVVTEIASAYEQGAAGAASLDAYQQAVAAAQQAYDAELALFRAGETSSRQVLDAELDLRVAQLQWVDGLLSVHVARVDLERAVGRDP